VSADIKAVVRRYIEEGLNAANTEVILSLLAPDAMRHGPGPFDSKATEWIPMEAEAFAQALGDVLPPLVIEQMVAEGSLVVTWAGRGVSPMQPSSENAAHRRAETGSTTLFVHRIECGRIAEEWVVEDTRPGDSEFK